MIRRRIEAPAVALIVTAALDAGFDVFWLFSELVSNLTANLFHRGWFWHQRHLEFMGCFPFSPGMLLPVFGLLIDAVIIYGAVRMKNLSSYSWAVAAAVLALIPCLSSPCCAVGVPFGLWALLVLLDRDVRAAFVSPGAALPSAAPPAAAEPDPAEVPAAAPADADPPPAPPDSPEPPGPSPTSAE